MNDVIFLTIQFLDESNIRIYDGRLIFSGDDANEFIFPFFSGPILTWILFFRAPAEILFLFRPAEIYRMNSRNLLNISLIPSSSEKKERKLWKQ